MNRQKVRCVAREEVNSIRAGLAMQNQTIGDSRKPASCMARRASGFFMNKFQTKSVRAFSAMSKVTPGLITMGLDAANQLPD